MTLDDLLSYFEDIIEEYGESARDIRVYLMVDWCDTANVDTTKEILEFSDISFENNELVIG